MRNISRSGYLLVGVVLVAACLLSLFKIEDPDAFWHLKAGQVMLETGSLIHVNLFSHTFPEHPWHNLEWLFQVALAAAAISAYVVGQLEPSAAPNHSRRCA